MATQVPLAESEMRRHGLHPRLAKGMRMAAVLILLLAGWGYLQGSPPGISAAYVDFTPATSYATALQTITDLGLQTALPCSGGAYQTWVPMGARPAPDAPPLGPRHSHRRARLVRPPAHHTERDQY